MVSPLLASSSPRRIMGIVLACMLPGIVAATIVFGAQVLTNLVFALVVAALTEVACVKLSGGPALARLADGSAAVAAGAYGWTPAQGPPNLWIFSARQRPRAQWPPWSDRRSVPGAPPRCTPDARAPTGSPPPPTQPASPRRRGHLCLGEASEAGRPSSPPPRALPVPTSQKAASSLAQPPAWVPAKWPRRPQPPAGGGDPPCDRLESRRAP